jgi:ribonuclease R
MARRIAGGRSGKAGGEVKLKPTKGPRRGEIPDRETLVAYLRDNPSDTSKREIAKAFGIKGDDRVILKALIKELAGEGALRKEGSKLLVPGVLPAVATLDIFSRDRDGLLLARPVDWDAANGPSPLITIKTGHAERGAVPGVGERVLAKLFRSQDGGYTGRVLKKIDKRLGAILGVFRELPNGDLRIEPVERRQPELLIDPEFRNGAKDGDLVEIEPVRIGRYGITKAKVITVAGNVKSERAISLIAIHMHGIPNVFAQPVMDAAHAAKPAPLIGREDWRSLPLITIDPYDAKDHDDAVYAQADANSDNEGGHIITVAIADVSHYIRTGSPIDREALKRGNSTYFPDRVVPMLPERISNDLCSLRENEDRPALAVRMIITKDGRKLSHKFHRVMMRSHAKVSYSQAQAAIDGATDDKTAPLIESALKPLWAAYFALRRGRDARMPLDLDLPERKILLNADGSVDKVIIPERLDAHRLVEEMMILANVATAETLEAKGQPLIYRVHDQPSLAKQESLREFLKTLDIPLAKGVALRPKDFNVILSRVRGTINEALTNQVVLRSQSQAIYDPNNIGHFGLNLRKYAHFTSPIRRYSDLIAHRALIKALSLGEDGLTGEEETQLVEVAAQISTTERRSMAAERDTIDRLIANHLKDQIGETFDGRIAGVVGAGLFVTLPAYGADGFVPVSTLGDDYYHFIEASHALIGERSGQGYRLGDQVEVKLTDVQVYAGSMKYEMVTAPVSLPGVSLSFHKARGGVKRNGFGPKARSGKGAKRR